MFCRGGGRLRTTFTVLAVGLTFVQLAFSAAPPAGTSITNQATASYRDGSGAQQLSTSNTVVTTVTQVGAYTLTPSSNKKSAAAGATVYMPYVLTNSGNGSDSFVIEAKEAAGGADFSKIEVYADNGAGQPTGTTPLCTFASDMCTAPAIVLAAGESYKFVVAYTVPSTATPATWPGPTGVNTATVTVKPSSNSTTWFSTYAQATADKSEARTDEVNLTVGAAFSVGKALVAPAVSAVGGGAWPVATSGPRQTTTTYTINYSNTGAAQGNLYIKDMLPAGLTYVAGKSVMSCAAGTALTEAAGGDAALCSAQGIDFVQSGQTVEVVIPNVQPVSNGTLSFQVTVTNTAKMGVTDTRSLGAEYTAEGCSSATVSACQSATLVRSNTVDFTVTSKRGVTFNTVDATAGTPASATDGVVTSRIVPGSFVKQTHTITNSGDADDNFNLTVGSTGIQTGKTAFPAGTTFSWFGSDGATPLLDTNSDGTIDTGVIAAGASKTVILQIFVPSSTTVASPANLEAVALAQSVNDASFKDATFVDITNVIGGLVDLTNTAAGTTADIGPGPSQMPVFTTTAVQAGSMVHEISLWIKNNDAADNTFSLQASNTSTFLGSLPAGWSVSFSSSACATPVAITSVAVSAGQQAQLYACVKSPATSPTTTQPVYFKVTATQSTTTGAVASDVIYDAVSVVAANAYSFSLTANASGSVVRGNNVDYSHTLINTGEAACGAGTVNNYIKVSAALTSAQSIAGWTAAIYKDVNNNSVVDTGDTLITDGKLQTGGLAVGQSVKFIVRVYAPGGANSGDVSNATVTVTDVDSTGNTTQIAPNGCGTQSNVDTSTVVTGSLSVLKKQGKSTGACSSTFPSLSATTQQAAPGDCLYYEVVATNNGASPVSNVSINDAAPTYTTLAATPAPTCQASGLATGSVAAATSGSTVSCGSAANTLSPSGTLTLRFAVQLQAN
jgi:trimeric autotransporter adhesin